MTERDVIDIDMEGRVIAAPTAQAHASAKLLAFVILAAVAAGVGAISLLAIGLALFLVPVAIGAAGLAWLLWRLGFWNARE